MSSTAVLKIALPVPLYQSFEYLAPQHQAPGDIKIGTRAHVTFGKRKLIGIIVGIAKHSTLSFSKLKTVTEILDTQPVFDLPLLDLLFWTANYYQQPLGEVLSAALPNVLRKGKYITAHSKTIYRVNYGAALDNSLERAPKQRLIVELLNSHTNGLSANEISQHTSNWRPAIKALLDKNLVKKTLLQKPQVVQKASAPVNQLSLNEEQQHAYEKIQAGLNRFNAHLLAGITGSGKTEVYLALAKDVIRNDKQVLILVPEIGLTPQLVQRIETRMGVQVALMHSNLNETERAQAWLATNTGAAKIIVGTRSAVFLPCNNLGLIIVDEEHDISFKQQEGFLYHARDIAIYRAKQLAIPIVLGSATPSFESQHNVNTGRYQKLVLSKRAKQAEIPDVKLIDLRSKIVSDGLSNELLDAIQVELDKKHQILLFLNRRGYAPTVLCHACGWIAECSRCDARMTFYKKLNKIKCHYCLKEQATPKICPQCNSENLIWLGEGTQRIENKLKEIFPDTAITRVDRDSTRKKDALQNKLDDIHNGKYQIIIGTQMLSKGHDFPGVTLVGILNVDHGLYSTDFRATERLAQLIVQVAGRAGRCKNKGKVLLQTHQPEHPLLNRLLARGYEAFSAEALKMRESCALPPYTFMVLVRARASQQNLTEQFLQDIKNSVFRNTLSKLNILGPIPAMLERKAGIYQSQLIIISPSRKALQQHLATWVQAIQQRPLTKRVRWNIEVDPLDME